MKGVWEFFPSLWTEEACDEIVRMALELPLDRDWETKKNKKN